MSNLANRLSKMSPIKLALAANEFRARADVVNVEPLAVIGAGCRFPGNADSPESFWKLLSEGVDGIVEVPPDRWDVDAFYDPAPQTPGKMISRGCGFVDHLREFDAHFFGISPREAISLDPQQRMLLEVTWETLENAGIPVDSLAGSSTGVFVGISGIDYFMHMQACNYEMDPYLGTGNALSVASGRLSFVLGLQGPSVSVDTACSSSLVAVHLACQSLRNRECDLALAGGTHRIILPYGSIGLSQAGLLAPDSRCKTFDAKADGYARGEGCGMVLLKRLSDAIADGDNIAALIRGSAINQDGKTSGLTVPNGPAQQAVIRKALENAAVDVNQIGYVETHGTGTPLGDPIEITALASVMDQRREIPEPLLIGSVKTNFGHLEASAGIAGLLKVVLALQHKEIPPHLHFSAPNPHIPWQNLPLKVATQRTPWPVIDGRRIGGVSSFGFSGTNSHAVLEETPLELLRRNEPANDPGPQLLTLSAKTPQALRDLVFRYQEYLASHRDESFEDICYTSSAGRTHFSQRLSLVADSTEAARSSLAQWMLGTKCPTLFEGRRTKAPKIGFFFGGESPTTAPELYERPADFKRTMDYAGEIAREHSNSDLIADAKLFAIQFAIAEMWRGLGIEPNVVAGQGVGQFAAACAAGIFSFRHGLELILNGDRSLASRSDYSPPRITLLANDEKYACDVVLGIGMSVSMLDQLRDQVSLNGKLNLPTLPSEGSDWRLVVENLAALYVTGASPKWDALYEDRDPRRVVLPTYPFQREHYWVDGFKPVPTSVHSSVAIPAAKRTVERARALDRVSLNKAESQEGRRRLIEAYIKGQLAEILSRSEDLIDQHEPLQSLGMDSLMGTELKYRIEKDLEIRLEIPIVDPDYSLDNFIDHVLATVDVSPVTAQTPNISLVRNSDGVSVASLLSANTNGTRLPFFCIHPGGIDISTYVGLAQHLDPDQPLYVLQSQDDYSFDNGEVVVRKTIEQVASLCLSEILKLRPEGPYLLGGWSQGALIAYDVAQRLKSSGQTIALLALLDVTSGPARDGSTIAVWFADLLEARTGRTLNYSFTELRQLEPEKQLETIWSKAVAAGAIHQDMPLAEFERLFDRYKNTLLASSLRANDYKLDRQVIADRIVFFNSAEMTDPNRRAFETAFDWTEGTDHEVETYSVPGNHYTMLFEPAVKELAAGIQRCLDQITLQKPAAAS
jgi:3-oxoacyl-(acyl-carrier-protein) synthase/thioesterase domain-containing protein